MKVVLRKDESGVSEVVGTILILAMTVVLFSTIIIWVTSFPTPVAQTRVDLLGSLNPLYNAAGTEVGDWINLTHQGGESMPAFSTVIYVVLQKPGNGGSSTDAARLHPFKCTYICVNPLSNTGTKDGVLDGSGTSWSVGQRYAYYSSNLSASYTITVTIVDTSRGLVLWTQSLSAPAAQRPPIFLSVWASASLSQPTPITPLGGQPIYIFAQVTDPSGYQYIKSVYTNITALWGTKSSFAGPLRMYDDGSNGDQHALDNVFTVARTSLLADTAWDGTLVLFNATDTLGHATQTRMTLHVLPGPTGGSGGALNGTTGKPPYLFWNGNQGYNIFNLTQWQQYTGLGIQPKPTRTFKPSDVVVVIVGSATLQDVASSDAFNLWDPFSGLPQQAVVYGSAKTVNLASAPSSLQAFNYYQYINGYNLYIYQFALNPASGTANFYTFATAPHPPYYFFARYPLAMNMKSSTGTVFSATDSINITSNTGAYQQFPQITTYKDPGYTQPSTTFSSTSVLYVKVSMLSADSIIPNVKLGNVMITDFNSGTELWRAPINGYQSNLPICPITGSCASGTTAISSSVGQASYYFAVNLSRTNQDPWIPGTQYYSFGLSSIQDSDETYGTVSVQVAITAPLYKMDVVVGTQDGTTNSWGTNNYAYYFQNYNGYDWWKSLRVDACQGGGSTTSGIAGNGVNCPAVGLSGYVRVRFGNFFNDGTLGIAEAIKTQSGSALQVYRRGVDASGSVVYLPVFNAPLQQPFPEDCNALGVGDLTGTGLASVICGGTDGRVWYYRNDGSWTLVWIDQTGVVGGSSHSISSISVGDFNGDGWNDVAVVGSNAFVAWYPNLGRGVFQNPGLSTFQPAVGETNTLGTVVQGTYLNTYPTATSPQILKEQTITIAQQTGATANPGFDTGTTSWTYNAITGTTNGSWAGTGGVTTGYAYAKTSAAASTTVGGYWIQPFTTSGSQPYTLTFNVSYRVFSASGATLKLVAWVSSSASAPTLTSTTGSIWASNILSAATGWSSVQVQYTSANWTNPTKISAPGTYYLKLEVVASYGASGSTVIGFDNAQLYWVSTAGPTSALQHYWYLGTMPTRPGITFSFVLNAQGNASTDFDNYTFAYSTNVVGNDPTTGTYTTITIPPTGNVTSAPTTANVSIAQNLQALSVWIRVLDTNRVAYSSVLDTLTVSRLYIYTFTPSGSTVQQLSGPTTSVTSSNAGDQNGDGVSDLVVGTSGGRAFLYLGSKPTGLQFTGTQEYYTGGASVVSVKFANIRGNVSKYGLQLAIATGTTIYFVDPSSPGTTYGNQIAVNTGTQGTVQAMGAGDVNGDGVDDVVVGTSTGFVMLFANFGYGYSWSTPVIVYSAGAQVYFNLAIGDAANNLYVGR